MSKTSVIIVAVLGVVLAAGAVTVGFVVGTRRTAAKADVAPKVATISREQFTALAINKTQNEVISVLGRPDRTSQSSATGDETWTYQRRTMDSISGKTDFHAFVWFRQGVAYKTSF